MSKKWVYCFAVLFVLILRFAVLNTNLDERLIAMGYERLAHMIASLRQSEIFGEFVGSWAMPVFVATVLVFWLTNQDDAQIPMHFLVLPIAYIPFSIVGAILATAEARLDYLWVHPLVILPFGYLYVSMWTIFIWLLTKIRLIAQ